MTNLEHKIIEEIKLSQFEEYGGYSLIGGVENAISRAMFGKDMWGITHYVFANGCGRGKKATSSYHPILITEEQQEKVKKVYNGMVKNGYLKLSKSGKMVKLVKEN